MKNSETANSNKFQLSQLKNDLEGEKEKAPVSQQKINEQDALEKKTGEKDH